MPQDTCEIRIYDKDFKWLGVTQLAESVQFSRELYGAGQFEIHIHPDKVGALELTRRGNIIVINGDGHKSGIIRDFQLDESREKVELVIHGVTGNGMAAQRITVPPTQAQDANALGWDKVSGPAETVIKHYAGRNMTTAYDGKRNFPRLALAADKARGKTYPWKSRYARLLDELQNIGTYGEMGFEIMADVASKRWMFDVIEGTDRSKSQTERSPVTFALAYQNIQDYRYVEDFQNYRTTGYAGGQGEDEKRLIYTLGADYMGDDRWEEFLDCGNAAQVNELIYYGQQKMNEYQQAKTLEAKLLPNVFVFDRDYFLGDLVTVYIARLTLQLGTRIEGIKEIWERPTGYRNEIRFGGKVPNLFTALKKTGEVR